MPDTAKKPQQTKEDKPTRDHNIKFSPILSQLVVINGVVSTTSQIIPLLFHSSGLSFLFKRFLAKNACILYSLQRQLI